MMEIKLFESFSGKSNRLLFKDPKSNKALKESPDLEEYLQGVIDLGFTSVIVECSEARSKDKYCLIYTSDAADEILPV
jgi:hypothetical protein